MGENFQRSGWPMCSRLLKGEVLHWKGGTWSHVGPLAATRLKVLARAMLVTWGPEQSRRLSVSEAGLHASPTQGLAPTPAWTTPRPTDPDSALPSGLAQPAPHLLPSHHGDEPTHPQPGPWQTLASMPPWERCCSAWNG